MFATHYSVFVFQRLLLDRGSLLIRFRYQLAATIYRHGQLDGWLRVAFTNERYRSYDDTLFCRSRVSSITTTAIKTAKNSDIRATEPRRTSYFSDYRCRHLFLESSLDRYEYDLTLFCYTAVYMYHEINETIFGLATKSVNRLDVGFRVMQAALLRQRNAAKLM